jgi:energy-converting hydrogenase Eha subunit G
MLAQRDFIIIAAIGKDAAPMSIAGNDPGLVLFLLEMLAILSYLLGRLSMIRWFARREAEGELRKEARS